MLTPEQIQQYRQQYGISSGSTVEADSDPRLNGFLNMVLAPAKESFGALKTLYGGGEQGIARKLQSDVQGGAKDIEAGIQSKNLLTKAGLITKGVTKSAFRTAGDVAGTVYAPVSAVLGATGLGKVFEGIGKLSQMGGKYNIINGITDMKAVQDFVSANPDLEEDFSRAMNLALAAADTGKIEPSTVVPRTIEQFKTLSQNIKSIGAVQKTGTLPSGEKYIEVGGKKWTADAIHNATEEQLAVGANGKKYSLAQRTAISNFDQEQSLYQMLKIAKEQGKPTADIEEMIAQRQASATQSKDVPVLGKVPKIATGVARDILPTTEKFINTEITKALDFTQGDVKNISLSTGNEPGQFIAKNNLIGEGVIETKQNIDAFYKQNYDAVRAEIGKVKAQYPVNTVPRYREALTSIKSKIQDVPGLKEANAEVDALLSKKVITLSDVQNVKELLDEHFSLYRATGDVQAGVEKSGLANIRSELKTFIENQVKLKTGADVREMNNNVQTARSISDAIETRSTRGMTRATISAGDIITFLTGSGFSTPVGGVLAVIAKRIYQSPTFKLKLSRWLDSFSDARRARIMQDIEQGKVPPELKIQSSKVSNQSNTVKTEATERTTNDTSDSISTKPTTKRINKQGGAINYALMAKEISSAIKELKRLAHFNFETKTGIDIDAFGDWDVLIGKEPKKWTSEDLMTANELIRRYGKTK